MKAKRAKWNKKQKKKGSFVKMHVCIRFLLHYFNNKTNAFWHSIECVEENKRFRFTMSDDVQIPEFIGYTEKFQLLISVFSEFFFSSVSFCKNLFFSLFLTLLYKMFMLCIIAQFSIVLMVNRGNFIFMWIWNNFPLFGSGMCRLELCL